MAARCEPESSGACRAAPRYPLLPLCCLLVLLQTELFHLIFMSPAQEISLL